MELTIEEVKEELQSYIHDLNLIEEKETEIEEYREKATSCTSQLSDMPKGSSKIHDKVAEYAAIIADLQIEKYNYLIEMEQKKKRIEDKIDKIKQPYKNILYYKYIKGYNLTNIAAKLSYEYKWTCKLHGTALEEYRKQHD